MQVRGEPPVPGHPRDPAGGLVPGRAGPLRTGFPRRVQATRCARHRTGLPWRIQVRRRGRLRTRRRRRPRTRRPGERTRRSGRRRTRRFALASLALHVPPPPSGERNVTQRWHRPAGQLDRMPVWAAATGHRRFRVGPRRRVTEGSAPLTDFRRTRPGAPSASPFSVIRIPICPGMVGSRDLPQARDRALRPGPAMPHLRNRHPGSLPGVTGVSRRSPRGPPSDVRYPRRADDYTNIRTYAWILGVPIPLLGEFSVWRSVTSGIT